MGNWWCLGKLSNIKKHAHNRLSAMLIILVKQVVLALCLTK